MKKLSLVLCLLLTAIGVNAQNNLFEELAKYEGQEFKAYYIGGNSDVEGGYRFEERDGWLKAVVKKDSHGKGIGLELVAGEGGQDYLTIRWNPRFNRIDHYTEPSFSRSNESSYDAILMVDGLLFDLGYTSETLSKFDPDFVYVPRSIIEKPKEEEATAKDGKKKGKFKAFMKNVGKAAIGKSTVKAPHYFKSIDSKDKLKSKIASYLEGMRKKQAANPLNTEDQKRWQEVIDLKKKGDEEIAEYNRKFFESEEGKAQLEMRSRGAEKSANQCQFIIKI